MPSQERSRALPNIPGSAHLAWPQQRRRGPAYPRGACANRRRHGCRVRASARPGIISQNYRSLVQFPVPTKHSLLWQKKSLFRQEQGIGCRLLNPLGERLPKPPQGAGIGRSSKYSLLISLFSVHHRALARPAGHETSVAASAAPKVGNPLVRLSFWHDPRKFVSC